MDTKVLKIWLRRNEYLKNITDTSTNNIILFEYVYHFWNIVPVQECLRVHLKTAASIK